MAYARFSPHQGLSPFVESIWVQEAPADAKVSTPTTVLPVGSPDLVVQFGDPFVRLEDVQADPLAPAHMSGQRTRPTFVRATGSTGLVIVRFRPWGASSWFGDVAQTVDRTPDLGDLIGRHLADELVVAVGSADCAAGRVRAIERFLLGRLKDDRPDPRVVASAIRIRRSGGVESVERVAAQIGMSRRHLVRLFQQVIGVPPKMFARIVRFQHAAAHRTVGRGWSDVAQATGYSDQSHLHHEFFRFAGKTPVQFARDVAKRRLGRYFNSHESSQFYDTIYL